jgi:hypothetical protein
LRDRALGGSRKSSRAIDGAKLSTREAGDSITQESIAALDFPLTFPLSFTSNINVPVSKLASRDIGGSKGE